MSSSTTLHVYYKYNMAHAHVVHKLLVAQGSCLRRLGMVEGMVNKQNVHVYIMQIATITILLPSPHPPLVPLLSQALDPILLEPHWLAKHWLCSYSCGYNHKFLQ